MDWLIVNIRLGTFMFSFMALCGEILYCIVIFLILWMDAGSRGVLLCVVLLGWIPDEFLVVVAAHVGRNPLCHTCM